MIRSFKAISKSTKAMLVVLSDGALEQDCRKEIQNQRNIKLVGRVPDVLRYLQASDFFISTSLAEGLPNAVLEAMACGLPVLLSDIPPHREIFELDRNIGKIFPAGSTTRLTQRLEELLPLNHESMRISCLDVCNKYFSAKSMAQQYMGLYEKMMCAQD